MHVLLLYIGTLLPLARLDETDSRLRSQPVHVLQLLVYSSGRVLFEGYGRKRNNSDLYFMNGSLFWTGRFQIF
jgi:hypothetical protein